MKNFDIKNRVKLYSPDDFQALGKLSCFSDDDEIIEHLEEASDEGWFALIDGDLEIEGNLILDDFFEEILSTFDKNQDDYIQLLWITGELNISKTLHIKEVENYCDDMVVEKTVNAKNIIAGGINLYFLDKINLSGIYYYKSNAEGLLSIKGQNNIFIETDNNNNWQINKKTYDLYEGLSKNSIGEIFNDMYDFIVLVDDLYFLKEELFIEELINGNNIFN